MSLTGRLEDLGLADIFQILSIGKKSGTLSIKSSDNVHAVVVFRRGLVVRAETDALEGDIGDDLLKAGLVDEQPLKLARDVNSRLPNKSIAEVLVDLGSVKRQVVDKVAKKRIERVVYRLLLLEDGEFRFDPEEENPSLPELKDIGWELSKGVSAEYLLMEGARVYDETKQFGRILEEEFTDTDELFEDVPEFSRDILALRSLSQELRFPESLSEISLLILRFASDIFQRGILFSVEGNFICGLGQFGLEIERADERIREMILDISNSPFFLRILREAKPYRGILEKDPVVDYFIKETGGGYPSEVALFPIFAEGSTIALLYCDNQPTGDPIEETPGLEIFISQAGLALEKAILKKRLQEKEMKG